MQIIPMENIHGRDIVEKGNFCERKNGRGVDPNRNWDVHWGFKEKDYDPAEEHPGAAPFRYIDAFAPRNLEPWTVITRSACKLMHVAW